MVQLQYKGNFLPGGNLSLIHICYGSRDLGALMAMLVLAILPVIMFYLLCQKYIIKGVVACAVKG